MAAILTAALMLPRAVSCESATNVILFIGDGMGLEQIKAGRYFAGTNLIFETWTNRAEVKTYSANSLVTDSAAAGTAMATGHKANNGVISVALPGDASPYETVLEYAKRKSKRTGLVTTSYMTDATPAAFAAHENSRSMTSSIAADYLSQTRPNVLMGGGGSGLSDATAHAAGYTVVTSRLQMLALNTATQTMVSGQFGSGSMPYEYDGLGPLPHLSEMTTTALDLLARATNGFFLMAEGGLIDHACHETNIARCVREVVEFDNAVRLAVDWVSNRTDTLIIVTADHETGGLVVTNDAGPGVEPEVRWSTTGHTGTNVGLFAIGPGAGMVTGVMDNTDIYRIIMLTQPIIPAAVRIGPGTSAGISTTWDATPGGGCRLEAVDEITNTNWMTIATVTALTHAVSFTDTNPPVPGPRFYRLIVTPNP